MNRKCILRVTALLFAALPLLGPTDVASADVVKLAGPKEVRAALKEFSRASKAKSAAERMDAVRALASVHHEKATVRLVKFTRSEDDPEVLAVAFEALAGHKPFAKRIVPALADRIADEARREHKRMSRGDAGIRIDPRSGDPDVKSPDGLKRLRATELRSRMLTSLLRTLNALEWTPRRKTPDLTPFLQDASDDLVVAVLTWMGRTNVTTAIPALLELFRMYPTEVSWET
ncbi:MAG: hypothetical protein QNJ90_14520, partial [Planctomycetota bacterium]|nr:hypothetical protein [Planctomycetota bacterium]